MDDYKFNVNKKIEVLYEEQVYKSLIQDITDRQIYISIPIKDGNFISIRIGESFEVLYYEEKNVFKFDGIVIGRSTEDNVPLLIIAYPQEIRKIQRREFFRVEIIYFMQYLKMGKKIDGDEIVKTLDTEKGNKGILLDISGGGMKLKLRDKLKAGDVIVTEIPMECEKIIAMGRVVRCEIDEDEKYICGVAFKNIDNKTREKIIRFLFDKMRKRSKIV
jgi:c-di-GMP-binding flagellar brake protein YcgR